MPNRSSSGGGEMGADVAGAETGGAGMSNALRSGPASAAALRTWKTFLQDVQRTRTPLSVTFSSAMRKRD